MARRSPRPSKRRTIKPAADLASVRPLTLEEIARQEARALNRINRTRIADETASAAEAACDGDGDSAVDGVSAGQTPVSGQAGQPGEAEVVALHPRDRVTTPGTVVECVPSVGTEPRQMTVWEDREGELDAQVIAGWLAATTPVRPSDPTAVGLAASQESDAGSAEGAMWHISASRHLVEPEERRKRLMQITTRDEHHLVQRVRPAAVALVLEHPHMSEEADRRLTALGIRFGVWMLPRTVDGQYDPYRDLTEDRIAGFVRDAGNHLSIGSRDSYAAALRRLAAGPVNRHKGERRKAVEPLWPVVEAGLWAAANTFDSFSWRCREAKTLLALAFGAGASAAEINRMAPHDVLVDRSHGALRVSVQLVRSRTWEVRDVPVLDRRYAVWLADRAAQVAGQTHLFKPEVTSRDNVVNATTSALADSSAVFERFNLPAARNAWAIRWLQAGIPFQVWATAAGIGPGTHLPTDLLAYLPTPTPEEIADAFHRADRDHTP